MRNLLGGLLVAFVIWLGFSFMALIFDVLYSNEITATITTLAFFSCLLWSLYKVVTFWLNENDKEGNN